MKAKYGLGMVVLWTVIFTACVYPQNAGGMVANRLEKKFKNMTSPSSVMVEGKNMGDIRIRRLVKNVLELKDEMDISPTDARLDPYTWEITESVSGKALNVEKTIEAIMIASEGDDVFPIFNDLHPKVTTEFLQSKIREIGIYSTFFNKEDEARSFNIKKASKAIHNYQLSPKESFSFNEVVGNCSVEKGYQYAPIILKKEEGSVKELGEGGGVCQVSSTLYNASLNATLEILERHSHSILVGYVPEGKDATIVWGLLDFRFQNTRENHIMIQTRIEENMLTIRDRKSVV
jgi:vancomycin resistance protein YoaR